MAALRNDRGTVLYAIFNLNDQTSNTVSVLPVFNNGDTGLTRQMIIGSAAARPLHDDLPDLKDVAIDDVRFTISYPDGTSKISNPVKFDSFDKISWADDDLDTDLSDPGKHAFVVFGQDGAITRFCDPVKTQPC